MENIAIINTGLIVAAFLLAVTPFAFRAALQVVYSYAGRKQSGRTRSFGDF